MVIIAINLASKYSKKVDERFKMKSLTESGVNHEYDWTGVKSINVYSIPTVAMGDYTRTGTARYGVAGELQDTIQNMAVSKDRAFTFTIDRGNHIEQEMVKNSGKALARQIDEIIVPEIDKYRLTTMATAAVANGGTATTAVTVSNAYSMFLNGGGFMSDNMVPITGRIAFVTPAFYSFLKQDNSFIKSSEIGQKMLVTGQVGEVDGVRIIMVPSSYFPASTSYIMAHPSATVAANKLEDYKTHDNPPGVNGWLVEGRTIYDAFVLTNKVKALYTHKFAI